MDSKTETYAYFWVTDFDCSAADITRKLELSPTDVVPVDPQSPSPVEMWRLFSPIGKTVDSIDLHIESLLEVLDPLAESVRSLGERYSIGINCVGHFEESSPGFHMSKELLQRVAALGLSLDFDFYVFGD